MPEKPLILVTNDDGITAPGIRALIEVMNEFGEVCVVAPNSPQSGMGHAITLNSTLHIENVSRKENIQSEYSCSGTPADCVKLAVNEILDRKPDLCVSGINHGSNSAINVLYSGTMSAAIEAGIEGIPSIGFSSIDHSWNADFESLKRHVRVITENVLKHSLPEGIVLNVNFPKAPIKGIKVCRQAKANWIEEFDKRTSPQGKEYYWLTGEFVNLDNGTDTDLHALEQNYATVVPVQFDLTAHHFMKNLNNKNFEN